MRDLRHLPGPPGPAAAAVAQAVGPPVVLDAMGGDGAPGAALDAAATLSRDGVAVLLCGPSDVVGPDGLHAPHAVHMGEDPAFATRSRPLLRMVEGFIGNVEPSGMLAGTVDVVVTDGSTGNLVLKTIEAMAPRHPDADSASVILGVRGTVLVAHGDAGGAELAAAVRMAMAIAPPAVTAPRKGGAAGRAADDSRGTGR